MPFITIIGLIASIATGTSLLPQLFKMIKEKKASTVSPGMLALLFIGLGGWIYYGILKHDLILIISNGFSLIVNAAIAILSFIYKKQRH